MGALSVCSAGLMLLDMFVKGQMKSTADRGPLKSARRPIEEKRGLCILNVPQKMHLGGWK